MKFDNKIQRVPPGTTLVDLAIEGLKKRVTTILETYPERNTEQQAYWDRLNSELDIINKTHFSGTFLMLSDIVTWAKDSGIPVGPSRGPITGSLVAYAIGITDIDPLRYNLLFERFLNTDRRVMPGVDIDFCEDRRDEVIQYVIDKYCGELDCDGCRLRIHLPVKHIHGVSYAEATSPVMFDFHGNKALTVNNKAVQLIRAGKSPDFDFANLRDDDQETFKLIASGSTENTFQFESGGIKDFIRQVKPNCFEDLIAIISIFRFVMIETGLALDFIKRKHKHRKIVNELSQLMPPLKDTYGVTIYQEQFLEIFRTIGGYSLGEADLLRRGLIKMDAATLSINKERFLAGAIKQGISARSATITFNRLVMFGEHYFLKAHAAAYAMLSYQSAYLKAHYPEEFKSAFR